MRAESRTLVDPDGTAEALWLCGCGRTEPIYEGRPAHPVCSRCGMRMRGIATLDPVIADAQENYAVLYDVWVSWRRHLQAQVAALDRSGPTDAALEAAEHAWERVEVFAGFLAARAWELDVLRGEVG